MLNRRLASIVQRNAAPLAAATERSGDREAVNGVGETIEKANVVVTELAEQFLTMGASFFFGHPTFWGFLPCSASPPPESFSPPLANGRRIDVDGDDLLRRSHHHRVNEWFIRATS